VRALAQRSREAGLDTAAYLLDMAALEIGAASGAAGAVCSLSPLAGRGLG
jgi:hypothetical protein